MLGHYKFLDSRFIQCLLTGKIRFGRLLQYRMLETVTKDYWIGDAMEGVAHTTIDNLQITPNSPELLARKWLKNARVAEINDPKANVSFIDSTIINEIDCFVFCFARGELDQLTKTMCPCDPNMHMMGVYQSLRQRF